MRFRSGIWWTVPGSASVPKEIRSYSIDGEVVSSVEALALSEFRGNVSAAMETLAREALFARAEKFEARVKA